MSLILEALKKSEARRQLGEAPGLGTPFTVTRRRRNPLPVILIAIVAAAGIGWYVLRSSPATDTTSSKPPADAPQRPGQRANAGANDAVRTAGETPVTAVQAQRPPTPAQPAPRPGQPPGARPMPAAGGQAAGASAQRPDMAALRAQRQLALANNAAAAPAAPPAPPAPAVNGENTAEAALVPKPTMTSAAPPPNATAVPQPPAAPPAPAPAPKTAQNPAAAPAPILPKYYELPYNVRKDLPPLNVTMHVYAAVPAQRFIVIDGDRKAEGDALKDGLTLREIRNDGIIFEFRSQQFFYPRPGR